MASERLVLASSSTTYDDANFSATGTAAGENVNLIFDQATDSGELIAAIDRAISLLEQRLTEKGAA